jgi:hypothetical protein
MSVSMNRKLLFETSEPESDIVHFLGSRFYVYDAKPFPLMRIRSLEISETAMDGRISNAALLNQQSAQLFLPLEHRL